MLDNFPGFLGYGGIIAIHANWPIYPKGLGWEIALQALGNFPTGTTFYEIDDIDGCKLLINKPPDFSKDVFNSSNYHVACWHEALIDLQDKNYVEGILKQTEYEFELAKFENLKKELNAQEDENRNLILYYKKDGKLHQFIRNRPIPDEEEEFEEKSWAAIPEKIQLTKSGLNKLIQIAQSIELTSEVNNLTTPLLEIGKYDTAVREASLLLEHSIKTFHKINKYGQNLIEHHITDVIKHNNNFASAAIKCYRGELRTIFSFIRNDFAHNFKILTSEQCKLILARIDDTYKEFHEVVNAYYKQNGG